MKGFPSKVLIVSDYPHTRFSERILTPPDFILSLGNVELQVLSGIHAIYQKPFFAVKGNHDSMQPFPAFVKNVHFRVEQFRNWMIGGWEGGPVSKVTGHYQWDDLAAMEKLEKFPNVDIFICNAPLAGVADKTDRTHYGSQAILRYVQEKQPRYIFHGQGHTKTCAMIGETSVMRVGGAQLVSIE